MDGEEEDDTIAFESMMTYIGHIARVIPQHSITCIRGLAISPTYYYCQHKTLPITLHRFSLKLYIYIYILQAKNQFISLVN